jgi:Rieske Fe-S protein
MDCPARAGASHLIGKITLGLVDALTPEQPGLVLACETHSAPPTPILVPQATPTRARDAGHATGTYIRLICSLVPGKKVRHHQQVASGTSSRGRLLLFTCVVAVSLLLGLAVFRFLVAEWSPGAGWVRVGSIQDVRSRGVLPLPEVPAYVVADPPRTPIALLARSTHLGERVFYCRSSGWFEDPAHGTKFDRLGNYELGPAPRGLDRLATLVQDGVVWVNPNETTLGPPRGSHDIKPAGPFCST